MSTRTTVTLDDDVLDRVKRESRSRGLSFGETLNELLRAGLVESSRPRRKKFRIKPVRMGYRPGLPYDNTGALIEFAEGSEHR
jgi:hypothetical protein